MVRINPDPVKAEKQVVMFGNRRSVRFYAHDEIADKGIIYHKFWFHPDDITPWATNIVPWVNSSAPGDYEEDTETKKKYIVKIYEDRYVLPFPSDEQQTLFVILTDFCGEPREPAQKIDKLLRKLDYLQSEAESLRDDNTQLQIRLREGEAGWRERLMKESKTIKELSKGQTDDNVNLGGMPQ